jgi:plasmid stabilization system protein ParE
VDATLVQGSDREAPEAVATVVYSARSLDYIQRAFEFPQAKNAAAAKTALAAITGAIDNLAAHPLIGRRVDRDLRELIISYGPSGYVAIYRFVIARDEVRILAIRHQREVGYLP